jgi:aryl-alcohol dehydrogenase-like predicted oxidoreductase
MQTDYIDVYQMHHIDRNTPWEEIWQAFETLVAQGKVLYAGSSNFAGWHIAQANEIAKNRHFMGLVTEQSKYSLLCRTVELEVLPACAKYGVGVIPWSPLAGGLLAGSGRKGGAATSRRDSDWAKRDREKYAPNLVRYEALCKELGHEPADVAIAWLLANPAVTAPIIGPRTRDQLVGSLKAFEIKLDTAVLKKIDEIFPGPGGTAPEAYAW